MQQIMNITESRFILVPFGVTVYRNAIIHNTAGLSQIIIWHTIYNNKGLSEVLLHLHFSTLYMYKNTIVLAYSCGMYVYVLYLYSLFRNKRFMLDEMT